MSLPLILQEIPSTLIFLRLWGPTVARGREHPRPVAPVCSPGSRCGRRGVEEEGRSTTGCRRPTGGPRVKGRDRSVRPQDPWPSLLDPRLGVGGPVGVSREKAVLKGPSPTLQVGVEGYAKVEDPVETLSGGERLRVKGQSPYQQCVRAHPSSSRSDSGSIRLSEEPAGGGRRRGWRRRRGPGGTDDRKGWTDRVQSSPLLWFRGSFGSPDESPLPCRFQYGLRSHFTSESYCTTRHPRRTC